MKFIDRRGGLDFRSLISKSYRIVKKYVGDVIEDNDKGMLPPRNFRSYGLSSLISPTNDYQDMYDNIDSRPDFINKIGSFPTSFYFISVLLSVHLRFTSLHLRSSRFISVFMKPIHRGENETPSSPFS